MSEWREIKSAPKDGTEILTFRYRRFFSKWDYGVVKWTGTTWMVKPTKDGRLSLLGTHWKPLSPPNHNYGVCDDTK